MSEKLVFKCPSCGAAVEYSNQSDIGICPYCKTNIVFRKSEPKEKRHFVRQRTTPAEPKKPFYWRYLLYLWLASLFILAFLLVLFPVDEPGSPNAIRASRVDSFISFDLGAGVLVILLVGLWKAGSWIFTRIHDWVVFGFPKKKKTRSGRRL